MSRILISCLGMAFLLFAFSAAAGEEPHLEGRSTVYVNLSYPTGGAKLDDRLEECALVIDAEVTAPKLTHADWLGNLPSLQGQWQPLAIGEDKGNVSGGSRGFRISSLGGDLGGKSDKCFVVLTPVSGDFSVTCLITWERAKHDWAKAGIIWRESLDAESVNVAMVTCHKQMMRLQSRTKAGDTTRSRGTGPKGQPTAILRLERQGNTFRGQRTTDGQFWVKGKTVGKFKASGYLGFVVSSRSGKHKATANFAIMSAKGQASADGNMVFFTSEEFQTVESGKVASITLRRVGDGKGELEVPWTARSRTAQAGRDFVGASGQVTWKNGETGVKKITIPVTNNSKTEKNKVFSIVLKAPKSGAKLGQRQASVTIVDDDGAGCIRFERPIICVTDRKARVAHIKVLRIHGKKGAIGVRYATRAGGAMPGRQYQDVSGKLTWENGDNKPKIIKIPIIRPDLIASNPDPDSDDLLISGLGLTIKKDPKKEPKRPDPSTIIDEDE